MTSKTPHPSRGRRIAFRLAAVVLVPSVVLGGVEGLLRLMDIGHPTGAVVRSVVDGEEMWVANPWATTVWFGPVRAREATPFAVPVERSASSVRVLVVGGSAVQGDPDPSYSPTRVLDRMLRAALPDRNVEVVNLGMTAINSWVVRDLVRDAVPRLRPDVTVVLMGNNEVVGPYGAASERGPLADHPGLVQLRQRMARLRMVQLAARAVGAATPAGPEDAEWLGMEAFLDREIAADAPELERTYAAFRRNLDAIVDAATRDGGATLLATVPVNLKGCAPFASRHRQDLGAVDRDAWQRAFDRGKRAVDEGRPDDAVVAWTEAAAIDDRHAELMYRLAVVHDELGRQSAAGYYHLARDLDVLRFRADSRINHIVREVAEQRAAAGVRLVDLAGAFAAASDGGVPGDALFYEHVHFTFGGAYLVARELLAPVLEGVDTAGAADLEAVPDPQRAVERLAFTPWDRIRVGIELGGRLRRPPFSRQLDNADDLEALERWIRELRELLEREGIDPSLVTYRGQLATFPDDWILHFNLGNLLLYGLGDAESAEPHHRVVVERHPEFARGWTMLGWDLLRQGRSEEAVGAFRRSLDLRPDPSTMTALGTALGTDGRFDEALDMLERAVAAAPDDPGASHALGVTLMRIDPDDPDTRRRARALFERVLELDPRHEPARVAIDQMDAGPTGTVAAE